MTRIFALIIIVIAAVTVGSPLVAQTDTVFTYQGESKENGGVANGVFNLDFTLWDALAGGNQIGSELMFNAQPVVDGRFTVELDFGASAFDNSSRWLEITVNGTELSPRQPITRAPYSIQTRGIFVDAEHNVGIGTAAPSDSLHVRNRFLTTVALVVVASASFGATKANAQSFGISWYTIDGGGGYSNGGNFELEGTIGQPDAGTTLIGGNFEVRGGFWVGVDNQGPFTVTPNSLMVTRGQYFSGDETDLAVCDNSDLSLRRLGTDIQSRTEFEVKSTSLTDAPTSFEFTLEGSVFARGNVVQTIELFDYVADAWELVDSSNAARAPAPDKVVTATPTGDLSRFVEAGTMCIEARIRYLSDSPRQRFASNTDQAVWTIGQ